MNPRIAILASGGGTTAEAFIRAGQRGEINVDVGLVIVAAKTPASFSASKTLITNLTCISAVSYQYQTHPAAHGEHVAKGDQTAGEEAAILAALLGGSFDLIALMGYMKLWARSNRILRLAIGVH